MTQTNENGLNDQEDYLNTDNDKMQDAGNSDTAKFNTDEREKFVNEREQTENSDTENLDNGSADNQDSGQPSLSTQGDAEELEENMGGTTNLSLDQLKKEHDPEGTDDE